MSGRLQEFVIRTSPWPPFRWAYAAGYGAALLWIVSRLRAIPEIRSLDLRPPRPGHCFGSSDLDLRAETAPLAALEFFALAERLADVLVPGSSWLRVIDLYAFPEAEAELQTMVASQSTARDRRWIRLLGKRPVEAAPVDQSEDARLGRATYDYESVCQDVLEGPLDLHRTRLLYSRVVRIHQELDELRAGRDGVPAGLAREVLDAARGPALRGRVRRVSFEALARAHALALADATALARSPAADARIEQRPPADDDRVAPVVPGRPPDTLAAAVQRCREAVADLYTSVGGAIRSVILGAVPGSRYEYRIYLIVREDLGIEEHVALCRATRELFVCDNPRVPYLFFRRRYPLVLTPPLWRAAGRCYHALRPVDEHYFLERHGAVLWGDDVRADLVAPDRAAVERSAAIGVADLRNRIWSALHLRNPKHLADLLTGRIPTLWLLLARSRAATSPAEAVEGCVEYGFPHAAILAELSERLTARPVTDLPPVDDPLWRPALEALTDWLDALAALALAALGKPRLSVSAAR